MDGWMDGCIPDSNKLLLTRTLLLITFLLYDIANFEQTRIF